MNENKTNQELAVETLAAIGAWFLYAFSSGWAGRF